MGQVPVMCPLCGEFVHHVLISPDHIVAHPCKVEAEGGITALAVITCGCTGRTAFVHQTVNSVDCHKGVVGAAEDIGFGNL